MASVIYFISKIYGFTQQNIWFWSPKYIVLVSKTIVFAYY